MSVAARSLCSRMCFSMRASLAAAGRFAAFVKPASSFACRKVEAKLVPPWHSSDVRCHCSPMCFSRRASRTAAGRFAAFVDPASSLACGPGCEHWILER